MGNQIPTENQPVLNQFLNNLSNQNQNSLPNQNQNSLRQSKSQPARSLVRSTIKKQSQIASTAVQKKSVSFGQNNPNSGSANFGSANQSQQYRTVIPNSPVKAENAPKMTQTQKSPIRNVLMKAREAHHGSNPMAESKVKKYHQNDSINMNLRGSKSSLSQSKASSESENKSAFNQFVTSIMSPKKMRLPLPEIFENSNRAHSAESSLYTSKHSDLSSQAPKIMQMPQIKYFQLVNKAQRFAETNQINNQLRQQIQFQRKKNENLEKMLKEGNRQKYELKTSLMKAEGEIRRLAEVERMNKYQIEQIKLTTDNQRKILLQKITNLSNTLRSNQQQIINLTRSLNSLQQNKNDLENKLSLLQKQFHSLKNHFDNQQEELLLVKNQYEELTASSKRLSEEKQMIETANKFWKQQNQELNAEYDRIRMENDCVRNQMEQVKEQLEKRAYVQQEISKLRKQYEQAKSIGQEQINILNEKNRTLSSKIQELTNIINTHQQTKRNEKIFQRDIIYDLKHQNEKLWDKIIHMQEHYEDIHNSSHSQQKQLRHIHSETIENQFTALNKTGAKQEMDFEKVFKTVHSQKQIITNNSNNSSNTVEGSDLRHRYENFIKSLQANYS